MCVGVLEENLSLFKPRETPLKKMSDKIIVR
jgi:hypothetical protein